MSTKITIICILLIIIFSITGCTQKDINSTNQENAKTINNTTDKSSNTTTHLVDNNIKKTNTDENVCKDKEGSELFYCNLEQTQKIYAEAKNKSNPYICLNATIYSIMPKDVYTCIKEVDTERKVTYESITPLLEKYKNTTAGDTLYYWLSKYNNDPRYCDLIENIQINSVVIENCKNYFS